MNQEEIKTIKEYYTPRTQQEQLVFDKQIKQKLNTMSFFCSFCWNICYSSSIRCGLGVTAVGAGVYCTCKLFENYKLATENLNLYHAMKKEHSIHTENYKELGQITETINNKDSTIGNIWSNVKRLRTIEQVQKGTKPKI